MAQWNCKKIEKDKFLKTYFENPRVRLSKKKIYIYPIILQYIQILIMSVSFLRRKSKEI